MVAPYNYLPQGQTPVQALTSGLQLGAQLAQSREAQEASRAQAELRRQQAEEIRRKVVEAEQARAARDAARSNFFKNPTPQTALEWGNTEPPAAFKEYAPFISQLTNEQAVKAATDSVRRWGLINSGRGQMVADEFLAEAEARRAAGNTQGADFSERQARLILEAPEVASTNFLTTATMTPQGRDILKAYTDAQPKVSENFVTLDAAGVAKRFQLPSNSVESGIYKVNTATNEITAVGRGGTTINMKTEGPPPQGWQYERDDKGNVVRMVPIPGGPAERQQIEQSQRGAGMAQATVLSSTVVKDSLTDLTKYIKDQSVTNPVTGIPGKVFEKVPGSNRATAQQLIETVKANIGFDRLNQMRQESPTGGALGNVTERELEFLQNVLGSLNLDQNDEQLLKTIERLQTIYTSIMKKAQAYPTATKYGFAGGAPSPESSAPVTPAVPAPKGRDIGGGFRLVED